MRLSFVFTSLERVVYTRQTKNILLLRTAVADFKLSVIKN